MNCTYPPDIPPQWDAAGNKLDQVAAVAQVPLESPPIAWDGHIILWGHDKGGPFSILEGNHRLLAYAHAKSRPPLSIEVYVGLSLSRCFWHLADPPHLIGNDLCATPSQFTTVNDWLVPVPKC